MINKARAARWTNPKALQPAFGVLQGGPSRGPAPPLWHRRAVLLFLAFVVTISWGCVPIRYTTSPGAKGRVIDAATHQPISGAEVAISRSIYPPESPDKAFANSRSPTVMSDQHGVFSLPPERRFDIYCIPVDSFPRFGLLVIKRSGIATTCVPFWSRSVAELGEILVPPAPELSTPQ